ncbi:hypothetical protein N7524_011835 [Penicillium chrysogenum]|nr:hypothetical protein N7524_011835 [Penicillium chrysogenum]
MDSDCDMLLETLQRVKQLNFCPNRIWAVAGKKLPELVPDFDIIPGTGDNLDEHENYNEHNECTPNFCEYSQRDFTAVQQRHECKEANCRQLRGRFSRVMLERAVRNGKPTVWNLAGDCLLEPPQPYMAISHVWSDGTGTGAWKDGDVNECLYTFFQDIAKQFQCDGIWWDTLCIPREKAARIKALQQIQTSYEDARITLVHDGFLRNWEWDPKTACFAILMSPWFSRGWTALELTKSRKVKVIFRGHRGPIIKDLDEEILGKDDEPNGPRKEASWIIRNLRKKFTTLNDLLTVLSSRYTSWPKDIAIISALLVGIIPNERQQDTYKSILTKFGRLSPGHLFHNSITMSKGFSWCPAKLFDMPLDSSDPSLTISEGGDVQGKWRIIPVGAELEKNCWWDSTHSLIRRQLKYALTRNRQDCHLLAECGTVPVGRALLVRKMQETSCYQYIGAVYLRQELREKNDKWIETTVTISGYRDDMEMTSVHPGNNRPGDKEDASHLNLEKENPSNVTSKTERLHCAIWRGDYHTFHKLIEKSSLDVPDQLGRRPLHLASERGNKQMVEDLVRYKVDLDVRCDNGQTALHRAAWAGSAGVVRLLQDRVDEMAKDKAGNTALHIAAQMGFASVVELLIKKSPVNVEGYNNLTPLHFAAMNEHRTVVELLKDADVEAKDYIIGWTSLHCAADNGDQDIVKLLIHRGAEVNVQDDRVGWTPLHLAAMNGHKLVVGLLLRKGAKITAKDKYDWTPQRFAEINGHTEVFKLLHDKSADAIFANEVRWTPLHCKAINNERGFVKTLAYSGSEVFFSEKDKNWTPLQFAIENGLETAIRRLLEVGFNIKTKYGQTSLHWAAEHGHKAFVRLMLEKGVDKEAESLFGGAPLHCAAERGHREVAQLLLEAGADKDSKARDGCTPLHRAASNGHEVVVRLLLEVGAHREAKTRDDRTPLHKAAESGHEAITRLLLENGADKEAKDADNQTPLHDAAKSGHEAVARLLVKAGADKDSKARNGNTPLHRAASGGHEVAVRLLLEAGAFREPKALDGSTPLHDAAEAGHEVVARLLVEAGVDKEAIRWDGCTPLHRAAIGGHEAVVWLLLENGADKEAIAWNRHGVLHCCTPLHGAAIGGHEAVTQLLLEKGADMEAKDSDGCTPLHRAASRGHEVVVRLLEAGAHREAKARDDRTPLHKAAHAEAVKRLLLERTPMKRLTNRMNGTQGDI